MFNGALDDTITGWTEKTAHNVPADRRFILGCGPFNLIPGQMVEFDLASVFTRDTISTYTIGNLFQKNRDDVRRVQQWFAVDSFPSCLSLYTGIDEHSQINNEEVSIYPNPSEGVFQIKSTNYKIQNIKVMNIIGEEILETKINEKQATIDMSGVAKGIYFVQITDANKNVVNRKIVVE